MDKSCLAYLLSLLISASGGVQINPGPVINGSCRAGFHGKLFLTGIDIRFDNVIAFIDFSNCLPLIDTAIIGKVN